MHHLHLPSHQALRLFMLIFATGLAVLIIGALIAVTLPKHTGSGPSTNTSHDISATDLSQVNIHLHGLITTVSDHAFTIVTQGVTDREIPGTVTVLYSEEILSSVDTAAPPDPTHAATTEPITPDELRIGSTVDVTVKSDITKDTTEVNAVRVLLIL